MTATDPAGHAPTPPAPCALAAGAGALVVRRVAGRSVATRAVAASPLRWLLPDNRGHALWAYVTSLGGGLVDGDALALAVDVGPGAALLLATQASTKVFRGPRGASQSLSLRVRDGALAVVLPDPVVCFADARYRQRVEVELEPGGALVLLDALHAGRVARGERWAFAHYASRIDVRRAGRLALSDRLVLDPAHGPLAARLAGFDALATLVLAGDALEPHARALRERLGARVLEPVAPAGRPAAARLEAAGPLPGGGDGALVRVAARTAAEAHAAVRELLGFVAEVLGDNPFARRW